MDASPDRAAFRAHLRSRWGRRSRVLGAYATVGSFVFLAFDLLLARGSAAAPALVALRLPWVAFPVAGGLAAARAPGWRGLPGLVIALSVAYTWANDWTYYANGLAGSPVHALALVICIITAATFLPLAFAPRMGVLALQALGHLALELGHGGGRPLRERLWGQLAVLCLVLCVTVVFENFTRGQRRGLALRLELERMVRDLEESRRRATAAAAALQQLAARVAHEVNNPLAAVKVNVGHLVRTDDAGERREVGAETLEAVERIAAIVGTLRQMAAAPQRDRQSSGDGA